MHSLTLLISKSEKIICFFGLSYEYDFCSAEIDFESVFDLFDYMKDIIDYSKEFIKNKGTQFDPQITNAFLDILNNEYDKIDEIRKEFKPE